MGSAWKPLWRDFIAAFHRFGVHAKWHETNEWIQFAANWRATSAASCSHDWMDFLVCMMDLFPNPSIVWFTLSFTDIQHWKNTKLGHWIHLGVLKPLESVFALSKDTWLKICVFLMGFCMEATVAWHICLSLIWCNCLMTLDRWLTSVCGSLSSSFVRFLFWWSIGFLFMMDLYSHIWQQLSPSKQTKPQSVKCHNW